MTKVVLVNPPKYDKELCTLRDEICFQNVNYTPFPIRLAQIGGILQYTGKIDTIVAIDANALGWSWDMLEKKLPSGDIYFFQSAAGLINHDLRITKMIKEEIGTDVTTVLIESTIAPIYPERFLNNFKNLDIIVRGQPESVVPNIIKNIYDLQRAKGISFRKGDEIISTQYQEPLRDLDDLPFMAYNLFPMDKYTIEYLDASMHTVTIPGIRMRTTHDCPYGCPFCIIGSSIWRGYDNKWRTMSPKRVVDEIEYVVSKYGIKGFFFWDETFTLDQNRIKALCDMLIERNLDIIWRCLTRVDCVSPETLKKMYKAGCKHIEFGVESGDPKVRKNMNKKFGNEQAINAIKWTKQAGIFAYCDFIIGMPWETKETLKATLSLARRINADGIHLTMAFPYPETEFYKMVKEEGLIEVEDIYSLMISERVRVGAKPIVRSRELSSKELEEGWKNVRKEIDRYYFKKHILQPSVIKKYLDECNNIDDVVRLVKKSMRKVL